MAKKILSLSISTKYVSHWGLWESIRELLQNGIDAETRGFELKVDEDEFGLRITSIGAELSRTTLLMGETDKANDKKMIGHFGEGYKLALLVLVRLGYKPIVKTPNEVWIPKIARDETFGADVLKFEIHAGEPHDGVSFLVPNVRLGSTDLKGRYRKDLPRNQPIPNETEGVSLIYVNGLYVQEAPGFMYSYNFSPERLELGRDRSTVSGFNLQYATSAIWSACKQERMTEVMKMINDKKPDVEYVISQSSWNRTGSVCKTLTEEYKKVAGDAIPVSNQEEIDKVTRAGLPYHLVDEKLRGLLWSVGNYFIPEAGSPRKRMEKLIDKIKHKLDTEELKELNDILSKMFGGDPKATKK